jgi:tRNA 2-thiouridine synthesizing protein A
MLDAEFGNGSILSHVARLPAFSLRMATFDVTEKTLNLRGLKCPLPALRAKKALSAMATGDLLTIECTDPLTAIDIPNLLQQTGDALDDKSAADGLLTFRIRKA